LLSFGIFCLVKSFPLALAALALVPQAAFASYPPRGDSSSYSPTAAQCYRPHHFLVPQRQGAAPYPGEPKRLTVRYGDVFEVSWSPFSHQCSYTRKAQLNHWRQGILGWSYRYVFAPGGGQLIHESRVGSGPIRRTYYRTALIQSLENGGQVLDRVAKERCLSQANYRATHVLLAMDSMPEHRQVRFNQVHRVSWNPRLRRCDLQYLGKVDPTPARFVLSGRPAFHFDNGRLIQRRQVGSGWGAASSISTSTFVRI